MRTELQRQQSLRVYKQISGRWFDESVIKRRQATAALFLQRNDLFHRLLLPKRLLFSSPALELCVPSGQYLYEHFVCIFQLTEGPANFYAAHDVRPLFTYRTFCPSLTNKMTPNADTHVIMNHLALYVVWRDEFWCAVWQATVIILGNVNVFRIFNIVDSGYKPHRCMEM